MEVTRRYWTLVAVGLFLACWGVVVAQPLALLGAAGVAAWLVARQFQFARAVGRVPATLDVSLTTAPRLMAEESAQLSVDAELARALPVTVAVTVTPPPGARGEPVTVTLGSGERAAVDHATLTWPVAGSFRVDDVTATISDDAGLFGQTADLDVGVDVAVDPRAPRDVHVGEGGDRIAAGFGEHEAGRPGGDVEPAEVREYVPGDAVRQIDWKSTARLDQPHVREFEGNTDRETLLFFDHRATMADGRPGTRKIDYARQLAVALVDQVGRSDDKLGYYAVGDGGTTALIDPGTRTETWRPVRTHLFEVEPTCGAPAASDPVRPTAARAASAHLDSDDSAFGRTLAPYFADRDAYRRRFDSRPLYRTVRNAEFGAATAVWTVIVTDDADRAALREAVTYARGESDQVTVFLTPTALFADGDVADLDAAYDRYSEFEAFRRELANLERVSAYEVGPADKLAAVLSVGRDRRRRRASA